MFKINYIAADEYSILLSQDRPQWDEWNEYFDTPGSCELLNPKSAFIISQLTGIPLEVGQLWRAKKDQFILVEENV